MKRLSKTDFPEYVSKVFKARLKELGLSQNRCVEEIADFSTRPTLRRIIRGHGSTNINTLAYFCEKLGLEIIIRPKEQDNEDKD